MVKRIDDQISRTDEIIEERGAIWFYRGKYSDPIVLEALATLLTAYALGSRSAADALTRPRGDGQSWTLPPRSAALDMATDVKRLAFELQAWAECPAANTDF